MSLDCRTGEVWRIPRRFAPTSRCVASDLAERLGLRPAEPNPYSKHLDTANDKPRQKAGSSSDRSFCQPFESERMFSLLEPKVPSPLDAPVVGVLDWTRRDVFVFNSALNAGNVAGITDFSVSQDKIQLDHSIFTGLQPGALPAGVFHIGRGAHDSTDHIIYNSSTGALSFDVDGTGGAHQVQFATLAPHLLLTASSFVVV